MYEFAAADGLAVSFQRFPYPATGSVDALPASCGALPVFIEGPGRILVPSPAGEGMWVGLLGSPDAAPMAVRLMASTRPDGRVDVLGGQGVAASESMPATFIVVPPHQFVRGIPRPGGGWWPLARHAERPEAPSCQSLELLISAPPTEAAAIIRRFHIELADAGSFTRVSGIDVPPLKPESAYGGWRLP